MKLNTTRMAIIMMAFGFLYACAPADHLQHAQTLKDNNRISAALESANKAVESNAENPEAHIFKAELLAEYAKTLDVSERASYYNDMVMSAEHATALALPVGVENMENRAFQVRSSAFNFEYESALVFLSIQEDEQNPAAMLPAIPHLENAQIIQPGYEDLYEAMVNVYTSNMMFEEAITPMLQLQESAEFDVRRHEIIGFLYYQTEDYERATDHLSFAWQNGIGTPNSGRGLANAYRKAGDAMSEREVLEQLAEIEPDNIYNHLALGKNLMDEVFQTLESLQFETDNELIKEQFDRSLTEAEQIEGSFQSALQLSANHILANISTGLFYRNFGFQLRQAHQSNPHVMSTEELKVKSEDSFYKSLNYLERASELDPDQPLIWNALWPVYELLGMSDQANEARLRAGE